MSLEGKIFKVINIFTSSICKSTLARNTLYIRVVAYTGFLEDKEAQILIEMFTRGCQNSSNYLPKDNSKVCKLNSYVMKGRGGNRKTPQFACNSFNFAKVNNG